MAMFNACLSRHCFAQSKVYQQLESCANKISGKLNVSARFIETMQRVYKFPVAMAALDVFDKGRLRLEQTVRISPSNYIATVGHSLAFLILVAATTFMTC